MQGMDEVEVGHRWEPITDLTDDDRAAASEELQPLLRTWEEFRRELPDHLVTAFNERLHREWAIETGIIERLYTLDEGTTRLLIEQGIDASLIPHDDDEEPPELIAGMIADHLDAVEWLFDVITEKRPLSTSFVKELHQLMTRKQEFAAGVDIFGRATRIKLLHGDYKRRPNNPTRPDGKIHQYCPPEHVAAEMDRLLEMHEAHLSTEVAPDVTAAWLHHRFVQIHPFQDGNGRVARAISSLVLLRAGMFPLVVTNRDRERYLNVLGEADNGDLAPLVALVSRLQKRWLVQALGITSAVRREADHLDQVLQSIGETFNLRERALQEELDTAKETATTLLDRAVETLEGIRVRLEEQLRSDFFDRLVFVDSSYDRDAKRRGYYRYQVIETARDLEYFANMRDYHSWARLAIETEQGRSEILLSFHGVNRDYRGLIGASVCFFRRQNGDVAEPQIIGLQPVCEEMFQVNYSEPAESVLRRFDPWLSHSLLRGLDQFRRSE